MTEKQARNQRRSPRQARSRATWEAIVEAAAQILERAGPDALTTNAIAVRAGVSIGTLYQYFPDKQAILAAAARRELVEKTAPSPRRRKALIQALIAFVEGLGRLGAGHHGAGSAAATRSASTSRKSPPVVDREGLERVGWRLAELLLPIQPALAPIPVRRRR